MAHVIHAPELDRPGLAWFNVPKPLSLDGLAGKLIIPAGVAADGDLARRITETWFH